jgi:predicted alpha/beta-fold hydrolase
VYKGKDLLKKLELPEFEPHPLIRNGFSQTIASVFWTLPAGRKLKEKKHYLSVDQDEEIVVIQHPNPKATKSILLVHGLNGSYESIYIRRLARRFHKLGYDVYCMNMRNCGPGLGRAKTTYHAGRSEDVHQVMEFIAKQGRFKKMALVGFSLGANVVLKCLGEGLLDHLPVEAAAVSPPMDLKACAFDRLQSKQGKFFDFIFSYYTFKEFQAMRPYLKASIEKQKWHPKMKLSDLDDILTARLNNFENATAYYEASSSCKVYHKIKRPTLILTSHDDPIVCPEFILKAPRNSHVEAIVTDRGGHVAFIDKRKNHRYWMDEVIVKWVEQNS